MQQRVDREVIKREAGRPRKKSMRRYTVRLLQSLHRKISAHCEPYGIGISYFIQSLVVDKFKELGKRLLHKVLNENSQLDELINNSPYAKDAVLYMVDQDHIGIG